MVCSGESQHVLSFVPGRIRLHLGGWKGDDAERIEKRLRRINGVERVQANPLTRNALVHFDPLSRDADTLLAKIGEAADELSNGERAVLADQICGGEPVNAGRSLVRVGVRGLLGHAVVDSLWFGAGFLGSAMGLPLAGLGPLHALMDIVVWTMALTGERGRAIAPRQKQQAGQSRRSLPQCACPV